METRSHSPLISAAHLQAAEGRAWMGRIGRMGGWDMDGQDRQDWGNGTWMGRIEKLVSGTLF